MTAKKIMLVLVLGVIILAAIIYYVAYQKRANLEPQDQYLEPEED